MRIKNTGFTLIELMVTVAIIGILGAVAVPAYQDYTIRSQVTEGLSLASGAKVQVAEYYSNHGRYPETMADLGMVSSQGSFISATALGEGGAILATFGKEANKNILGGVVSLIPKETRKGNLEWTCEANIKEKYLPNSCRENDSINDGSGEGNTDTNQPPVTGEGNTDTNQPPVTGEVEWERYDPSAAQLCSATIHIFFWLPEGETPDPEPYCWKNAQNYVVIPAFRKTGNTR